jgi:hypothetical protein
MRRTFLSLAPWLATLAAAVMLNSVAAPCALGQSAQQPVDHESDAPVTSGPQLGLPQLPVAPPAEGMTVVPPAGAPSISPPAGAPYESLPPPPAPTSGPPPYVGMPGGGPSPYVANPGAEEFWIASSWKCRQTGPHGCPCGDLEFWHSCAGAPPQLSSREACYASLVPGVPVCLVAHGSFTNWRGLCDECWPVYRWIRGPCCNRPLHVIFYTWPSSGPITYEPHIDVGILGVRSSYNGVYLADLAARIPPGHPICLFGHSHGARMVAASLHLLGGGQVDGTYLTCRLPADQRLRAVLCAGALDHTWFNPGQRFELALPRAECILVMRNAHDAALAFYPLRRPFSRAALGERGLSYHDFRKLGPMGTKVCEIDVSASVHMAHAWSCYYRRPELAVAIAPFIYFDEAAPSFSLPPAPMPQPMAPAIRPVPAPAAEDEPADRLSAATN